MRPVLRPTAPIAEAALLPGDPGRALALAQEVLERPVMSNHHRGLWGYHGMAADGLPLTIQATGIGGPSAVAVLGELAELGVRRAVRIGSCRALEASLEPGSVVVAEGALAMDGTSAALGCSGEVPADGALREAVLAALPDARSGRVASVDLMTANGSLPEKAVAADLATAPLFALGQRLGLAVGAVLVVSESVDGAPGEDELVEGAALEAGRLAAAALSRTSAIRVHP